MFAHLFNFAGTHNILMSLIKIDTRIPKIQDLILWSGVVAMVVDVDLRKKLVWINTADELQKIPLKKYDIYQLEGQE